MPSVFYSDSSKMKKNMTPPAVQKMKEKIGKVLSEAKKYPMLGLVVAHPLAFNLNTKNLQVEAALAKHQGILATLHFDHIAHAFSQIEEGESVLVRLTRQDRVSPVPTQRKRKGEVSKAPKKRKRV